MSPPSARGASPVQLMRMPVKHIHVICSNNLGVRSPPTEDSAMSMLKNLAPAVVIACSSFAVPYAYAAEDAVVTPLMTQALPEYPGKEVLMINVEYPPGAVDPVHRHDAHAFVYVLEGSIIMQVKGGKEVTLKPGQTYYEGPNDIHVVGRNASNTKPAKFVVFLVKDQGKPVLTVVK
jgi:quercetin dioxygenase-like cupin family protein